MEFGKKLKVERIKHNYTQKELAQMLNIAQPNISDWENNISRPEYEHLIKLSKIYKCTTDYLLNIESEEGVKHFVSAYIDQKHEILSEDKQEIIFMYDKLTAAEKARLKGYIHAMLATHKDIELANFLNNLKKH